MRKETNKEQGILAVGAAAAACGMALYAVGQVLKYLFRDVDPERIEKTEDDENDVIEDKD